MERDEEREKKGGEKEIRGRRESERERKRGGGGGRERENKTKNVRVEAEGKRRLHSLSRNLFVHFTARLTFARCTHNCRAGQFGP